ncbi:hypothetical protein [Methylovirgula sp. HY1]|uniref:hypothetical protein n=1 Tax=Methylovirgula sp. HY1 TaxID=2822761 RepID=UPI001C5BE6A0|nr:hypothetical protein [Methylovirgula sp. HY1]
MFLNLSQIVGAWLSGTGASGGVAFSSQFASAPVISAPEMSHLCNSVLFAQRKGVALLFHFF